MKKLFTLFFMILVSLTPIKAENSPFVDDQADLLTAIEEYNLTQELDDLSTKHDVSVVIVTINDLNGQSSLSYADDYYDYHDYKEDGILFLLSINDREYALSTAGSCIQTFTDYRLLQMENVFIDDLSYGYYNSAFEKFIDECSTYLNSTPIEYEDKEYSYPIGIAVSLGVGFLISLIVVTIMKGKLKTIKRQHHAGSYVTHQNISGHQDIYLYRHVSRQRKPEPKSGGSSVRVSSSGRSHGGRSGRF